MKIYYNSDGRYTKVTGEGIFQDSENINVIQFKIEDIPNDSVVFATFMLPFPENSNQYGNYSVQSLLLHNAVDQEDGGYLWESEIPNGYLRNQGTAYISARIHLPDGIVIINENEPIGEERTITVDGVTYDISYNQDGYLVLDDEENEYTADTYSSIIIGDKIYLIEGDENELKLVDGLRVKTTQVVQFVIYPTGEYVASPVLPETAEQIFIELARQQDEIETTNAQLNLKQDKTDNTLATENKTVVGAINGLNTQVTTLETTINSTDPQNPGILTRLTQAESDIDNIEDQQVVQDAGIEANTNDINNPTTGLKARVTALEGIVGSGEDYVGTYTNTLDPTDEEEFETLSGLLTDYVEGIRGEVQGGDVVIYVQTVEHGEDKNYKFIYSGSQGEWTYYEIPASEKSENDTYGIVKGSYGSGKNTEISVDGGNFDEIWVKDNTNTQRRLAEYLNADNARITTNAQNISQNTQNISTNTGNISTLQTNVTNILNGTTAVGKATSADKDGLNRNIVDTYMTQNAGATKQQLYDYALPRTFNDVSFLGANNQYTDTIPSGTTALYTATSTSIGSTTLCEPQKTITNSEFELGSKNSYTNTLYVSADTDCTVQYRITTQVYTNGAWVTLNIELTDPIDMVANTIKKINIGSPFNYLEEVLNITNNNVIKQTFEVVTEVSTEITFSVYSNETYPSTFYLNTTAQTIIVAQGMLGELPIHEIAGVYANNEITFNVPSEVVLNTNVQSLFKLSYSGEIPLNTDVKVTHNGTTLKLVTPYNFGTNYQSKVSDLEQLNVSSTINQYVWLFTAVTREEGNDKYLVVDEENLTEITNILSNKQDTLTAGTNIQINGTTISATDTTYESKNASQGGTDVSLVTTGEKYTWNSKQDALTQTQLDAVNSGIDSTKVGQIATNTSNISTNAGDIATINGKIPSTASSTNQLADKDFVNSSINSLAAYYITKNASGDPFATYAELSTATTFYSGGAVRVPTTNDYCVVLADETKQSTTGVDPTTRYTYQGGTYPSGQWEYQYTINNTPLTSAQINALNSGITSSLVTQIGTNQTNIGTLNTNKADKSATVSTVTYDTTNKKLTKTINGTTTDIVTTATLKTDMGLATVATSGSYNDLTDIPPTVNDATLTIQKNGSNVATFTANASSNVTANIAVPTSDSDLTNNRYVRYDVNSQGLNSTQQGNARTNIDAQKTLPTTTTAGQILKSTSTAGTLEWANLPEATPTDVQINGTSITSNAVANIITESVYNASSNKIATMSDVPTTASEVGAVAEKPDGTNDLISSNKINTTYLPDYLLGQLVYGGTVTGAGVATLSTNAKSKLGTTSTSITLTNDTTAITGYQANEGIYYIVSSDGSFASLGLVTGDWLISTGSAWNKIDNTDAVTSVNGQTGAITGLMTTANPTGTGSLSINRKASTTVGNYSSTLGYNNTASGGLAHAEGYNTTASGDSSHAEGNTTTASGRYSHAEGLETQSLGYQTHTEGVHTYAKGSSSHAEGDSTYAYGDCSHSEGCGIMVFTKSQHAFGEYNEIDGTAGSLSSQRGNYVEIVGNGTANIARSNARTLDWSGNEVLAGTLQTTGLKDGNNANYKLAIPTTTSWTADKTIATTDQIPNITITTTAGSQSVSDGTNTLNFGSNAFNSTTIPSTTSSVTSGSTAALTSGGAYTNLVSDVTYDSTNKKLKKTKGGSTTDLVTFGANAFNSTTIPTTTSSVTSGSTAALTSGGAYTALTGKLDKVTTTTSYTQVYAKNLDGSQQMIEARMDSAPNTLIKRDGHGRCYFPDPVGGWNPVTLNYANNNFATQTALNDKTITITTLWSGSKGNAGDITLNESMANYKLICAYFKVSTSIPEYSFHIMPYDLLSTLTSSNNQRWGIANNSNTGNRYMNIYYVNATKLNIANIGSATLVGIYGVK